MTTSMHYSRPPITEALIDLRVVLPEWFSVEDLLKIHERIYEQFPTYEPIFFDSLTVQAGSSIAGIKVDSDRQHIGFRFKDRDGIKIFQATLHGFTFNRLHPYKSWEEFSKDARTTWEVYKDLCKPENVTRAAVRYINQINIALSTRLDLQDYLRIVPEIPEDLPQKILSTFFMQLQIPQEDLNCMLIINETIAPSVAPNATSIILDIDLFRQQVWQSDDQDIWDFLETLRYRKNDVFKASITKKTEELFN